MTRFRCPHGHLDKYGRPIVHASRRLCPIQSELDKEAKTRPAAPAAEDPAPQTAPTPGAVTAPAAPLPKRAPGPWAIDYAPVTASPPAAEGPKAVPTDWEVSVETSEHFWENIMAVIEMVVDGICRFFEIPEAPQEIFTIDAGQRFVFRTALRPATTNFLKKVMGAKSPEEADKIVAGMSGLIGFGAVFWKIALHFWIHIPKSERFLKIKAKSALRRTLKGEERKRRGTEADTPATPEPPAGVPS